MRDSEEPSERNQEPDSLRRDLRRPRNGRPVSLILRFCVTYSDTTVNNSEILQQQEGGGTFDMALTVTKMTRVFQFNGIRLPDPNPEMSVDNVKALYSAQYPELTTAVVNGPEAVGDKMRYTFDRAIGSKG